MRKRPSLSSEMNILFPEREGEREVAGGLKLVERARIHTAAQPRTSFPPSEIEQLAASIRELHAQGRGVAGTGVLQPLLVRAAPDGQGYVLTAGERRLRASALAGIAQLPVVISSGEGEDDASSVLLLQLVENVQREGLPPLEEARGIEAFMEGQNLSIREAARLLGKDKGYIQNRLFLLKAKPDVQEMVSRRPDTLRHARLITSVADPAQRSSLIQAVLEEDASVATLERRLQTSRGHTNGSQAAGEAPPEEPGKGIQSLSEETPAPGGGQQSPEEDNLEGSILRANDGIRSHHRTREGERRSEEVSSPQPDPLVQAIRPAAAHLVEAARQLDAISITPIYRAEMQREIAGIRAYLDELERRLG